MTDVQPDLTTDNGIPGLGNDGRLADPNPPAPPVELERGYCCDICRSKEAGE